MNVLSIGTDRSLLDPMSESARRHVAYGAYFDEFNIIVFTRLTRAEHVTLATGIHVYATRSRTRLLYGFDAIRIARRLPKADVVTVQDPFETGLAGWFVALLQRTPLHVQVHTDFFSPAFASHSLINRIRAVIARFVLARAARIRVVSNRIKDGIEKHNLSRAPIAILPIFTDVSAFQNARSGDLGGKFSRFRTKVLVVSRLESEKNVALAIESFAKVAPEDACLIIVGEGSEKKNLEHLVMKCGIGPRVFFEGWQNPTPYYALAHLVLFPSRYDGYGNVIIEALAAGKPVLATDVGIAREAGAIITDSDHFTDALKEWFESGERTGMLLEYPYQSFEEYVKKYCDDISRRDSQSS